MSSLPEDPIVNLSSNPSFESVLLRHLQRRDVLRGGLSAAAAGMFGGLGLIACSSDKVDPPKLGFQSIDKSFMDAVQVPPGYRAQVFIPWGTPITGTMPAFDDVDASNSAADQAQQTGNHHDGMQYFPFPKGSDSSTSGILCVNHEYYDEQYFHPNGPTVNADGSRPGEQVRKEINGHGVSVVKIARGAGADWVVEPSALNRRITGATPMEIRGPVRGSALVRTKFSPDGTMTRGTLNNCAHGYTPWGTYLTCEENWAGYFTNPDTTRPREHTRFGVPSGTSRYGWELAAGDASEVAEEFARFNASASGASATDDYRNEPNSYGWVVEIDPFDPTSAPKKRTTMGRLGHEGCWPSRAIPGKKLAFYTGDDARFEYIYKFVTANDYSPATANGDNMLDEGTLYVARFDEDGSGDWLELSMSHPLLAAEFGSLAEILVNTRTAADIVGATKMDRPEWGAVNPLNGEVYMTLTNNTLRGTDGRPGADAANPRAPNVYGHVVRWREAGDDPAATSFAWDIFVFASAAAEGAEINRSGLTADNEFGSPDGLWFDRRGILWIQTDDTSTPVEQLTNEQMLAVVPGSIGDGGVTAANQDRLRRFLVGPLEAEITGIDMTPDLKTMFVNIQHPGEDGSPDAPSSTFPGGPGTRPRSCTVIITREDGGELGV